MGNEYVDIFATKGLEYLFVILFLFSLVIFWRILNRPARRSREAGGSAELSPSEWFQHDDTLFYHQGHTWLKPESDTIAVVGMDDFAHKLLGRTDGIMIPPVGTTTVQGERGWQVLVGSKPIDILSPSDGVVVARNESLIKNTGAAIKDPYSNGWVMKIRVPNLGSTVRNLLSGSMARLWLDHDVGLLRKRMSGDLGLVLQDGGTIMNGFAKALSPSKWDIIAGEFLRTRNSMNLMEDEASR